MQRDQLNELHYITPLVNVPSILERGLLSHRRAKAFSHDSVAMAEIQDRRTRVRVPGGRPLHEYVNLYFHARNPMLYKRLPMHGSLCVLRVSTDVFDLPGVVIADRNASSGYVRFGPVPGGLALLDHHDVFAESWQHPEDQIATWRHASVKCAEVLVPDSVDRRFILGAYVPGQPGHGYLAATAPDLPAEIDRHLFFR